MKRTILAIALHFGLIYFFEQKAYAQNNAPTDTLYYLLNLEKIPVNDRMITEEPGAPSYIFYTIQCPCMPKYSKPTLRINVRNDEPLDKEKAIAIKTITLATLIEKLRYVDFSKSTTLYFIVAGPNGYVKRRVFLVKNSEPVN